MRESNRIPGWLYREIDFSGISTNYYRLPMRVSESYDYILTRIQAQYFSTERGDLYDTIRWRLVPRTQAGAVSEIPLPAISTLSPGLFDRTPAASTLRPRSIMTKSVKIELPVFAHEVFYLEFEDTSAATGILSLLFIGDFILTAPVQRQL